MQERNPDEAEDDVYVIDYIVKHRELNGKYEYNVKWKGYGMKDCT